MTQYLKTRIHTIEGATTFLKDEVNYFDNEQVSLLYAATLSLLLSSDTPASLSKHHTYQGGLIVHTAQVMDISLRSLDAFLPTKEHLDIVKLGTLFHDIGKLREYKKEKGYWVRSREGELEGHISIGHAYFNGMARAYNLPEELTTQVSHIILSHHGRKEWGSPVAPNNTIAWLVHAADMASSQYSHESLNTGYERSKT